MNRVPGPRRALRIGLLGLLAFFLILLIPSWDGEISPFDPSRLVPRKGVAADVQYGQHGEMPHHAPTNEIPPYCGNLKLNNIAIIVRTGATEAKNKLPPQISTFLSCVPDPLIFSDLDQTLGVYQIHDVLSRASEATNVDFGIYYDQKKLAQQGRENGLQTLGKRPPATSDWRTEGKSAAWVLDKYKFLYMIERAWEYQPKKDWYVFIETDTYLSLPNLVKFLKQQNPKQRHYFGNAVRMWEHPKPLWFAHGGSGFVLSRATVEEFAVGRKGLADRYGPRIAHLWFGDFVVADALDEFLDVQITDVFPMMQADKPTNFPFARENWCNPVVTLHYMQPRDFEHMFEHEKSRDFDGMTYADLYSITYNGLLPTSRSDWNNGADEEKYRVKHIARHMDQDVPDGFEDTRLHDPHISFNACELACIMREECVQFLFRASADKNKSECYLSKAVRLGKAAKSEGDGDLFSSGWLNEKISALVTRQPVCPG